jgi:hypothetical protein
MSDYQTIREAVRQWESNVDKVLQRFPERNPNSAPDPAFRWNASICRLNRRVNTISTNWVFPVTIPTHGECNRPCIAAAVDHAPICRFWHG